MTDESAPSLSEAGQAIETYLVEQVKDDESFFKSKYMAEDLPYSAKQIGVNIGVLRDKSTCLEIESWAGDSDGSTWAVSLADENTDAAQSSAGARSSAAD